MKLFIISVFASLLFIKTSCSQVTTKEDKKSTDKPTELAQIETGPTQVKLGDGQIHVYRLALAATAEYTTFFGGKKEALAAQMKVVARVNELYGEDLSIRLELIPDNERLIFLDPKTDPYDITNSNQMMMRNQVVIDSIIGTENYDIGHLFFLFKDSDGISENGCICNSETKAQGVTGSATPEGDHFDIDFVAHEIGHQFGAHHVQSNNCQRNDPTAVEPGSGSTVMSYAGICYPNVQKHCDPYFHSVNIEEILTFITIKKSDCGTKEAIAGHWPHIDNMTVTANIPISTPFVLTGEASDADKDEITYCWEQMNHTTNIQMPPVSSFTAGPLFRSFTPNSDGARYFPALEDLTTGESPRWQVLPSKDANLKFNLTVRDNSSKGGHVTIASSTINVFQAAGPFQINAPEDTFWTAGSSYKVTWDLANTDKAPISCSKVDIILSTDGGKTFTQLLADDIANNGSAEIKVPDLTSDKAFLMVRSVDNVFFTVTSAPISIRK